MSSSRAKGLISSSRIEIPKPKRILAVRHQSGGNVMEGKSVAHSLQPESRLLNSVGSCVNLYIGPNELEELYVEHPHWCITHKDLKEFPVTANILL